MTEIDIFKKSETFFTFFKPWTLCENAGARAGIENQLKHQVEQYWVWQQPSLFEKKMAEKCIEWISRKFMCYFRRRIHSCTKFLKIAFYIWKTKWKWLVALLSQTRRPGAVRLSFALFSLIIDGVLFDQIYVTDLNLKLKLHIHLQFTHPKELIFWNNKRYFMAIFLNHLK